MILPSNKEAHVILFNNISGCPKEYHGYKTPPPQKIQKYPPLYHRTTKQLSSSGFETPQFIINTQFCKKDSLGFLFLWL